ncbi:hypothetical protein B1400_1718 [Bifidobacterium italicum]|uniref:Uncharacterized protein n=1 Tax=Bifidobacterium italicum TaxID=1960968 RepID=A0A2A2EDA1_9BIFI|nr:hypothetical protein B1400_1718 [Bifidobacterium italicum]
MEAPARSSADTKAMKPIISSTSCTHLKRTRSVGRGWRIVAAPTKPAITRNGIRIANIQRQPIADTPTPPTVGPSARKSTLVIVS